MYMYIYTQHKGSLRSLSITYSTAIQIARDLPATPTLYNTGHFGGS